VKPDDVLGPLVDLSPCGFHGATIDGATDNEAACRSIGIPERCTGAEIRTAG
jgi:hypothetical protein